MTQQRGQQRFWIVIGTILLTGALAACSSEGKMEVKFAEIPVGMAYAGGEEIYFMHTEASDPDVAALLTKMMDSPVLEVPALAQAPDALLANVYVFENGLKGMGPLGFQPDVFDQPPGSAGYSPLRRLNIVTWGDNGKARLLKSADEVLTAEKAGELRITQPGVVINMPFVTWPGGKR
ncbi:MAG: hypothetical protein HPY59_08015 [Anaerolineae bacterium]|nr:hypothetical protein [Anaerolineae bacterium]